MRTIERELVDTIAKQGHKVLLLVESKIPHIKNADSEIGGKPFEFKNMKSVILEI